MTEKLALYTIAEAFSKLDEMVENDSSLVEYLDGVQMQLQEKVNNIVRYSRNLELTAEMIDVEIKRLSELKSVYKNKSDSLKDYISYSMQKNGIEKVETDIARLSFRKSQTVEIEDISKLPERFVVTKVSKTADKKAIKEAIENGEAVEGARIDNHNNLQIK